MALTAAAGLAIAGLPSTSSAAPAAQQSGGHTSPFREATPKERPANYDAREGTDASRYGSAAALVAKRGPAFAAFAKSLGSQSLMDYDTLTGTPRDLGKLDGFLTGSSSAPARQVVMSYVSQHLAELGLTQGDLATMQLRQDYVDISGIHHLSWTQSVKGIPVFGNGLKANVTKSGQLISIQGSPVSGLAAKAASLSTTPAVTAASARSDAAKDVRGTLASAAKVTKQSATSTSWSNNDYASLVWFLTPSGLRLGWSTYVQAGNSLDYQHVIDASTGKVLYRHDTVNFDRGDALVFTNYPGATPGGKQRVVNFYKAGYLPTWQTTWLKGKYVIAWLDVNDDNLSEPSERTPVPGTDRGATKTFQQFHSVPGLCSAQYQCSWDPNAQYSWRINRQADNNQGFYWASRYHDYLMKAPIGFTPQAGNFELRGGDPVLLNSDDGADTAGGYPDGGHIDNANMSTPPDGVPPTMQMYLWHFPHTPPSQEPYIATSSSFDPTVEMHEYTHGLSNRLVVDAQGNSTLNSIQAGAMGEAWSDYYALDWGVKHGRIHDSAADGDVLEGEYLLAAKQPFRTEAIDCPVNSQAANCTQINGDHGGYTYGDFPTIGGAPEVHASGEVWAQTLWDLRKQIGAFQADSIITRGMSLAPSDPSMLDMRNAIIQANLAVWGGAKSNQIWRVFAHRGMGWYAGTVDAGDSFPRQDFHVPPSPESPRSTISGKVTDAETGDPVAGALVVITGHGSGFTGDYAAVTNAAGTYQIPNVLIGTYKLLRVSSPGYEVITHSLRVVPGSTTANFTPRRDWAAANGGGAVIDFNGPDYSSFNCGPTGAIDLSQGTGWGSTTGNDNGDPTGKMIPKFITIHLAKQVDVTSLAINPSNTCGDPGSSSVGRYKVQVSSDGKTFTTVLTGRFDSTNRNHLNEIGLDKIAKNVSYVKFWMLSPQVPDFHHTCPDGPYGGCQFTDMTEIEVFSGAVGATN